MSAKGAITMVLATEYVSAFDKDAATPASERTGRIGRNVSDWIRGVADGICESDAELAKLRAECESLRADVVRLKTKVNATFDAVHEHTSRAAARRIFAAVKKLDPATDAAMCRGEGGALGHVSTPAQQHPAHSSAVPR